MTDSQYLVTIQIWRNLNEHCYYLTLTEFAICQIDTNCSPFQWLNLLPFHIRLERLKLTYYSLVSNFPRYFFKTGTLGVLCHAFAALHCDSNYFGILNSKIKPRDHNETKPPTGKNIPIKMNQLGITL